MWYKSFGLLLLSIALKLNNQSTPCECWEYRQVQLSQGREGLLEEITLLLACLHLSSFWKYMAKTLETRARVALPLTPAT